jgi:hypothetical protein
LPSAISWDFQQKLHKADTAALWGVYRLHTRQGCGARHDEVESLPFVLDEMTISFVDLTKNGGRLAVMWDKTLATVPFTLAGS